MAQIKFNTEDGLLTITPRDAQDGPASLSDVASLKAVSSDPAAFADGVLDPPDQSEPGRVSYTMRCVSLGAVGAVATFHVTAGPSDTPITGEDASFELVEGDIVVEPAASLTITASAIPKVS